MTELSLIEKTLSHLLINPADFSQIKEIENVLENEQYILYFYIKTFATSSIPMSKEMLNVYMTANASSWLDSKEVYRNKTLRLIDKNYITSRVQDILTTNVDFCRALTTLVLQEYDRLIEGNLKLNNKINTDEGAFSFTELLPLVREEIDFKLGKDLLIQLTNLVQNGNTINKKKFTNRDIIPYVKEYLYNIDELTSSSDEEKNEEYKSTVRNVFIDALDDNKLLMEWNLGKDQPIQPLRYGHQVNIIGAAKAGKTSFVLGEIVYPILLLGKNVEYDSTEMQPYEIYASLISKHIHSKTNLKVSTDIIKTILKIHFNLIVWGITENEIIEEERIRKEIMSGADVQTKLSDEIYMKYIENKKEFSAYINYKDKLKRLILLMFRDLFTSGKYGKLIIYTPGDKTTAATDIFYVENIEKNSIRRGIENDISCLVRDHAGHYKSNNPNLSEVMVLKKVYTSGKDIATNKEHPMLVVTINHMDTSSEDRINKLSDDINQSLNSRAYGTSESRKACDLEMTFYATREDKKEGLLRMDIGFARFSPTTGMYKLVADIGVKNFYIIGTQKMKYPEKER